MVNSNMERECVTDEGVDLHSVFEILKGYRVMIITITLLFAIIAGISSYFMFTPVYEARTTLMITQIADSKEEQQAILNTYAGQVNSQFLMQRVINKLSLNHQSNSPSSEGQLNNFMPSIC